MSAPLDTNKQDRHPDPWRKSNWFRWVAQTLIRFGIKPNQISLLIVDFAMFGSVLYVVADNTTMYVRAACLTGAAVMVVLRLLCSTLDGALAVEGGMSTKVGPLFNELPGRIADSLLLIFAGYASHTGEIGITLGWACALFALLTSYVRALGAAQGLRQDYCGPMTRPHRMIVLTAASLLAALESALGWNIYAISWGLSIIAIGSIITAMKRMWRIAKALGLKK
jgi:phosphatidylglycerophosphate synthase